MRSVLIRAAVATALPLVAVACAKLPSSPVPAVLTELEAAEVAEARLGDRLEGLTLVSVEPTGKGYLLGYQTDFDPGLEPPKGTQLVSVRHDGTVREYDFRRNR